MIAVLLIAHGSRLRQANEDAIQLAEMLRQEGEFPFATASFLELAEPCIATGAESCVENGATEVLMMPFFLSAGRHVTSDLGRHQSNLQHRFPKVHFHLCAPIGLHPAMLTIVKDRLHDQLQRRGDTANQ